MPVFLLVPIYLAIVLLPLLLAWLQGLSPRSPWDELATGLGMLALSMILVEFALLGRFRSVTARAGSDVVMRSHQLLARVALVFVVLHPFLYVTAYAPAPVWDSTRATAVSYTWWSLWPGIVAWLLLGGLVVMGIARDVSGVRYETWRFLHGIMAVLVACLGVLHALRAGRYSADPLLAWVWIALLVLALAALGYVYVVAPLIRRRSGWRVSAVRPIARRTWVVKLMPANGKGLDYRAGQFAWLNIGRNVFSLDENPFSISSAPSAGPELEFIIKELGDFTDRIGETPVGAHAWVEAPHGSLTHDRHPEARGIALIAGGVGIAPLLGILRELHCSGDPRPTVLLYGNRTADQIVNPDELGQLAQEHETEIVHVLSEPPDGWTGATGMIDAKLLHQHFGTKDHQDWLYILCGPPAMLDTVEHALIKLGVPARNILSERFVYD